MPRKLKLEGLQAEVSAVDELLKQAIELGDPMGEYQFAKRKESIEKEISKVSSISEKAASVALLFGGDPVLGSRGISADFAGNILDQFQELVTRDFAKMELGVLGERGPIPLSQATKLMVTEVARGSFGFILDELSDQTEIEDTSLKNVVEEVSTILERTASPNEIDFEEIAEKLDERMLISLRNFFVTLDSAKATLRIVEDITDFTLDEQSIHRARRRTEATSIDESEDIVEGVLEGFLPEHRKFELKLDSGEVLYGSVTKEATEQYSSFVTVEQSPIGQRWKIKVQKRIVSPLNRSTREIYRLLEFIGKWEVE